MAVKFHRIWFGSKPMPAAYDLYWDAWRRQFPEHDFITWRDEDIQKLAISKDQVQSVASYACKADIARYEILYQFGGIYLDCDMMPFNYFDAETFCSQLTVCNEDASSQYCSIGFIGAPKGHPIFLEILSHIKSIKIDENRPNEVTGPWLFGAFLSKHKHDKLNSCAFYPYLYNEPSSKVVGVDLSKTYGIHIWGGSWLSSSAKADQMQLLLSRGDVAEYEFLSGPAVSKASDYMPELREKIRASRRSALQSAREIFNNFSISDNLPFQFDKFLFWLLSKDSNRVIWQIGAADGRLVDPLRSSMINFDPKAVLLEPNPFLFALLEKNYSNNQNAKLLNLAYSSQEKSITLNAINPSEVSARGLPQWVLGISSKFDDRNAIGGISIDEQTQKKIGECITRIEVATIGYQNLIDVSGGHPEVVVVDAEGMDKEIIDDVLNGGARPLAIHFEIQCLSGPEQQELVQSLAVNYVILTFGNDMTAYRKDIFLEYADSLYVDYGISNIYGDVLRLVYR